MTPRQYADARSALDLTQARLALRLGLTRRTICRRESGDTPVTAEAELALRALGDGLELPPPEPPPLVMTREELAVTVSLAVTRALLETRNWSASTDPNHITRP